jgi:hypothetical protein
MRVIRLVMSLLDARALTVRGSIDDHASVPTILVVVLHLVRMRPAVRGRSAGRRESGDETDQQAKVESDARATHTISECSQGARCRKVAPKTVQGQDAAHFRTFLRAGDETWFACAYGRRSIVRQSGDDWPVLD